MQSGMALVIADEILFHHVFQTFVWELSVHVTLWQAMFWGQWWEYHWSLFCLPLLVLLLSFKSDWHIIEITQLISINPVALSNPCKGKTVFLPGRALLQHMLTKLVKVSEECRNLPSGLWGSTEMSWSHEHYVSIGVLGTRSLHALLSTPLFTHTLYVLWPSKCRDLMLMRAPKLSYHTVANTGSYRSSFCFCRHCNHITWDKFNKRQ